MESIYGSAPVPVWGKCTFNNKSYTCSCTLYSCSSSADILCDSCSHPKLVHKITGHLKFTPRVSPPSTQLSPQTDSTCDRRNFSADHHQSSENFSSRERNPAQEEELSAMFGRSKSVIPPQRLSGNGKFGGSSIKKRPRSHNSASNNTIITPSSVAIISNSSSTGDFFPS